MLSEGFTDGWRRAAEDADLTLWLPGGTERNEVAMFFRRVPPDDWQGGDCFSIGQEGSKWKNEAPVHSVRLDYSFYLATFPVTQEQYRGIAQRFSGESSPDPSEFKGDLRPVEHVDWLDATAWCHWVRTHRDQIRLVDRTGSARDFADFRLPCEAEWEISCRAGSTTGFCNGDGDAALESVGWNEGNSGFTTHPVGSLQPNLWGLYDMHGNVWEWCDDVFDENAYWKREDEWPVRSWTKSDAGKDVRDYRECGLARTLKGGSCAFAAGACRSAARAGLHEKYRREITGFRPCLILTSPIAAGKTASVAHSTPA